MNVFLTGGTGLIGSAVLKKLIAGGHSVTALVRSEESGSKVDDLGAEHILANIENVDEISELVAPFDAVIHLASPSDETSVNVDRAIATAVLQAFSDTNKTYIHTSGIWVYGDGADITEKSSFDPPAITAWREDVEKLALSGKGMRTSIVAPGIVYGNGAGIPSMLLNLNKNETGAVEMIGAGTQHWTTVHVDDLADLYVAVLEKGEQGYYIGASGQNPTVQEIVEAVSRAAGNGEVYAGTGDDAVAMFGPMAEALMLDQQTAAAKSKALGWTPSGPSLIDELETGSYSPKA